MNDILIELFVPALGKRFDVFIPAGAKVFEIAPLAGNAVERLSGGLFSAEGAALFEKETGTPLDINQTPTQLKLKNGTQLLMI